MAHSNKVLFSLLLFLRLVPQVAFLLLSLVLSFCYRDYLNTCVATHMEIHICKSKSDLVSWVYTDIIYQLRSMHVFSSTGLLSSKLVERNDFTWV